MIRGKWLRFDKHAAHAMNCERPPIEVRDVEAVLDEPDKDDGHQAVKWLGNRTIIVYYDEDEEELHVWSVSATRQRLAP